MKKILPILLCFIILILGGCNSYKDVFENEIFIEPSKAVNVVLKQGGDYSLYPNVMYGWGLKKNVSAPPDIPEATKELIKKYNAYYIDEGKKNIYLTFDEGYENGCTPQILDILKENDVKAAFFVTKSYIKSEPEIVKRMAEEGHIVGNHSVTHPDMTTLTDDEVMQEILGCADYYNEVTGYDMPKFFRPPAGGYSVRTLEITKNLGYKTIFWSYAYKDWLVDEQPGRDVAYQNAMDYSHNGCIMLLHAVSTSNTEALDDILKDLKAQGFEFVSLEELN